MSKTGEATNVRIFRGIDPALDYRSPQSGKQPATLEIWKAKRKTGKWKLYYPYKPYSTVSLKQYF